MKRLISLVVVLLVILACKAGEPQKFEVSKLLMKFNTKTEQTHSFYGAGDFIINQSTIDCTPMKISRLISIQGDRLTIDGGTEYETIFKIATCTYDKGKVFVDRGTMELYHLSCNELIENELSPWTSIITIQKVKDGTRCKTIITIPSYDKDGVMCQCTILQD